METPPDETEDTGPARKPFAAVLQELNGGLHTELGAKLAEVINACLELGKTGSLTLKLDVAPHADGMTVQIAPDIKAKIPEPPRRTTTLFADEYGNLGRKNPMQPELPLVELAQPAGTPLVVEAQSGSLHVVNGSTGEVIG